MSTDTYLELVLQRLAWLANLLHIDNLVELNIKLKKNGIIHLFIRSRQNQHEKS